MKKGKHKYVLSFGFIIISLISSNINAQVKESKIDSVFSSWNNLDTPGGSVGVVRNGELIFTKGYGLADLEHDIPIEPSTVFYIGSNGKQFTAFCILLLEEQGKLKLDDDITKYLVDFPKYESPITIENLLYHTSGIRDYSSLWDLQGRSYFDLITATETYNMLKRQSRINFIPGEESIYSNGGYFLLSEIVHKITNKSLKDFAKENIFDPLNMNSTLFLDNHKDLIKNRAFGYFKRTDDYGFDNAIRRFELVGSGGVYSNLSDLYKWDQNFYKNKLGKGGQEIIDKMLEVGLLNNGESSGESAGIEVDTYKGLKEVSHGGSHGGFRTQLIRFPENNFSVIILANRSDANYNSKARAVADLYLKEHFRSKRKADLISFIKLSSEALRKFVGDYIDEYTGRVRKIVESNDTLFYVRSEDLKDALQSIRPNDFKITNRGNGQFGISFQKNKEGEQTFRFVNNGRKTTLFKRFDSKKYTNDQLISFVGRYYSEDLDITYQLEVEDHNLALFINHDKLSILKPIAENTFVNTNSDFGVFFFGTDKNNTVKNLRVNTSRIRKVEFIKKGHY